VKLDSPFYKENAKEVTGIVNKLIGQEKGQALIIVLVLMLLGGLIITPMLGYMGTGLKAGQVYENKTHELYAADAGVEYAIWQLKHGGLEATPPEFTLNGKTVNVTIEDKGQSVYKVTSVATSADGSKTTIVSYLSALDFSSFFDNAVTSGGAVDNKGDIFPPESVVEYYTGDWPSADVLSEFYLGQLDVGAPFAGSTIDIEDYPTILPSGPVYRQGDLEIINTGTAGAVGVLNETVYVTGNLDIAVTNQALTLDLKNQTIFVEGNINLGTKCTIIGSGCIIAVGDIDFSPDIDSSLDDFIFVMSIEGTVLMHPGADFYGAIAGNVEVTLQPGCTLTLTGAPTDGDGGLNFPTGGSETLEILTWESSTLQ